jgi:murein L,D-transpeptidase YcbB/YkuD
MRDFHLNRVLAGTALALVLVLPGMALAASDGTPAGGSAGAGPASPTYATQSGAAPVSPADIEARIPLPQAANVRPPNAGDVETITGSTTAPDSHDATPSSTANPSAASIESKIPMPESADLPPPSAKDIGLPGAPAAPATVTGAKEPAPIATTLAEADVPVAEKLRDLIPGKLERTIERKKDRQAVEAFYTARGFAPLWIEKGALSERGKAAIARLKAADLDGLDPLDYAAPDFAAAHDQDTLAQDELKLTNAVLTYARHASSGRFSASRISSNLDEPQQAPEPATVLGQVADAQDLAKTLDDFNPPHEGYRQLKAKLAELLGRSGDAKHIGDGPALKTGMQDARVPLIRERLGVHDDDAAGNTYDEKLAAAVKAFQRRSGMRPTGVFDARLLQGLDAPPRHREVEIVSANMERWRWMPRNLGKAYVMVNIPDYTLKVVRDGKPVFHTRIVVGKPTTPTPLFSDEIENIVMNPTWHVPESIIYKEYLPALQQDPTVLARMGLIVGHDRNGRMTIQQPPSERNALGRMKFNFPNKFNVYLHDTPDKRLFAVDKRAYSHGCMRVQNPTAFGEVLLSLAGAPDNRYSAEHLQRMFGTSENWLKLRSFVPVHITYQTAYVDDAGKLVLRDDIYGYDSKVLAALKNSDMRFADASPAPETHRDRATVRHRDFRQAHREVREVREEPFSFFGRIFR